MGRNKVIKRGRPKKDSIKKMGRPTHRPDPETLAFMLKHYKGREIAYMFGVKESTVFSWVCRDRQKGIDVYGK